MWFLGELFSWEWTNESGVILDVLELLLLLLLLAVVVVLLLLLLLWLLVGGGLRGVWLL